MPDPIVKKLKSLVKSHRVSDGGGFRLADADPGSTGGLSLDKEEAQALLQGGVKWLAELQDKLYAENRWGVLIILQAMDAAGKDGTIKHVMSGVNPQGCQVTSFKAPSSTDLDHDFLWRCVSHLPARGNIGIFNRSYYEEVLVIRVHPELLDKQRIPPSLITKDTWKERFEDINAFERHMTRNGFVICKIFLNISKNEQKRRFLSRIEEAKKNWKFSPADLAERQHWDKYQDAFEDMIRHTATEHAPWYVVPADDKKYAHLVVAGAIINILTDLDLKYPTVDDQAKLAIETARTELQGE